MSEDASGIYSFDRILNFRDVGKTINQYTGKRSYTPETPHAIMYMFLILPP